ncbi:MAG: DUF3301 domain-containing protein [Methylococcales bacterium]|nr:DUF3301 domain-containing protein [Methylococcales bacterium]
MDFFLIIFLLSIGYYWSDSMKTRELAFFYVKNHCQQVEVQLLDEYVALNALWLKKDEYGKTKIWRSYQFEFTSTGYERYNGKVIMLGQKIISIQLDPYKIID